MTRGSSVLSTVLVLISKFLGFHFKDKSPVDPILRAGGLLWKMSHVLFDGWFLSLSITMMLMKRLEVKFMYNCLRD